MRKIITSTYATLDGYIDDPHLWSLNYSDEQWQQFALQTILRADALLLGRVTYEAMAQAWPAMAGNPYSDHVNAMPKYVVASQRVDTSVWPPSEVIPGSALVDTVRGMKGTPGSDILVWGTGRLTDALAAAGLLDEYRIWTVPVIKGNGRPLFRPESAGVCELVDSRVFDSGAIVNTYRPQAGAERGRL